MKLSDFGHADIEKRDEIHLSEWVINGEHYPKVRFYFNFKTGEAYQVSEKHRKYRKTSPSAGDGEIQQFGKWDDLE